MWDVGSGKITIGGKDIREVPLEQLNKNIAYVAQDNFLFNESVRENIRKGNLAATDEEVENIAKASGCHEFIMKLENGYDTVSAVRAGTFRAAKDSALPLRVPCSKTRPIVILDEGDRPIPILKTRRSFRVPYQNSCRAKRSSSSHTGSRPSSIRIKYSS